MNRNSGIQTAANLAYLAKSIASIIRAALAGGLHGAAVAAAKSLAPWLLKLVVILLCVFLLLPYAVFAAIPNVLYGYEGATAEDVQEMNALALSAADRYQEVSVYTQEIIDEIAEDLGSGYDDVVINQDIRDTADKWFIAISSAAARQELSSITEEHIRQIIKRKLVYTTETETYTATSVTTDDEGNIAETEDEYSRLIISFSDLDPEALMGALGFDGNAKNWARLMYSCLSFDSQFSPSEGSGGGDLAPPAGGEHYIFTDGQTDVVYYNQGDPRWGDQYYIGRDKIRGYGCGPTSLAIAVSSFGQMIDPGQMAQWANEHGYACEGSGSYRTLISGGARHFGLQAETLGRRDIPKVAEALANGKLVICLMGPGHFTDMGHFIVLRGITAEGKVLVADPASTRRSSQPWDISLVLGECRYLNGTEGPIWILSKG